jgi:hypothetical protein
MNFKDYLNEKSSVCLVSIEVIWETMDRIILSDGVTKIVSGVFPYSVCNSSRINPISSYIDNLSSFKRLLITESILKDLE